MYKPAEVDNELQKYLDPSLMKHINKIENTQMKPLIPKRIEKTERNSPRSFRMRTQSNATIKGKTK